ncbi:MAG: glutamate cyclase domain-containing protein [Candidatus Methylomirabilis sp.]
MASRILEAIDRICLIGPAGSTGRTTDLARLYQAARSRAGEPLCGAAARRIEAAVRPGASVILLTGAGGPPSLPRGETDGPLGAAVLARGLVLALDARPILVAEARFRRPIVATLDALAHGSRAVAWRRAVRYIPFPVGGDSARPAAEGLWNHARPVAVISIERLGPNHRGVTHNAMGKDVTAAYAGVEALFSLARRRGVLTIGVGDRGNELGFGWLRPRLSGISSLTRPCACPCQATITCRVPADLAVVASVSNWGAYGMVAGLAVRLGDARLLHRPNDESRMLKACVEAGARDGLSTARRRTVDGLPLKISRDVVALLQGVVARRFEDGADG